MKLGYPFPGFKDCICIIFSLRPSGDVPRTRQKSIARVCRVQTNVCTPHLHWLIMLSVDGSQTILTESPGLSWAFGLPVLPPLSPLPSPLFPTLGPAPGGEWEGRAAGERGSDRFRTMSPRADGVMVGNLGGGRTTKRRRDKPLSMEHCDLR